MLYVLYLQLFDTYLFKRKNLFLQLLQLIQDLHKKIDRAIIAHTFNAGVFVIRWKTC